MSLLEAPETAILKRVYYLGDDIVDYDIWVDAFSIRLTGRPARRIDLRLLRLLGQVGDLLNAIHVPLPINSGSVFRMTTCNTLDLSASACHHGEA